MTPEDGYKWRSHGGERSQHAKSFLKCCLEFLQKDPGTLSNLYNPTMLPCARALVEGALRVGGVVRANLEKHGERVNETLFDSM